MANTASGAVPASHSDGGPVRCNPHEKPFSRFDRQNSSGKKRGKRRHDPNDLAPVKRLLAFTRRQLTRRRLAAGAAAFLGLVGFYFVYEARVAADFEAADAALPSRIYARPLVLRDGLRVDRDRVEAHLERTGFRKAARHRGRSLAPGQFALGGRDWWIGRRPLRLGRTFDPGGEVRIRLDRRGRIDRLRGPDGRDLESVVLEPELVGTLWGTNRRDRIPIELGQLPPELIQAVLTVEDRRFHEHGAIDVRRLFGAALANMRAGRVVQGGSTLTQQLARTLFLDSDRSLFRKLRETAIAFALERRYDKERLLQAYLNHIYLGQDRGAAIHGVGSAARHYFGKDASQLDLAESALLAGIIRGPSLYSPLRNPDLAKARRDLVLHMMAERGEVDDERLAETLARPIRLAEPPARAARPRYYLDHLAAELRSDFPRLDLRSGGLVVVSSLEPALQRAAEIAVRRGLEWLERGRPALARREEPLQAALVALEPASGEILAMVGGRSYGRSQFNRATRALRQPGSAFKPVVALAALAERGGERAFTLASALSDEPLRVSTPQGDWRPSNADGEFVGRITLREALEVSRNVPFARLGMAIGPDRVVETARRLGITSELVPVPSLALGASEVTLLELTSAYGVLAAQGVRNPAYSARAVFDPRGRRLEDSTERAPVRAFSSAETYLVTSALRGVMERGTGRAVRAHGFRGPVAGKSGTTNGGRDAWFIGYTPELAVGVWVGFDDRSPTGLSGSGAALPIFADFLRRALGRDGAGEFDVPDGIELVDVDPRTGLRAGWGCYGEPELFLSGTAPEHGCGREWEWASDPRRRWNGVRRSLRDAERWIRSRVIELGRRRVLVIGEDGG